MMRARIRIMKSQAKQTKLVQNYTGVSILVILLFVFVLIAFVLLVIS